MSDEREQLRRLALKPRDSWWTVLFVDAVTIRLLPAVLRLPRITPMGITLVGLLIGVATAVAFGMGWLIAGGLLFQLRYLVDCLDGKLARVRGLTSEWGRFADLAVDVATVGTAYAALGLWAWRTEVPASWIALALLAAYTTAAWLHLYRRLALGEEERTDKPRTTTTRVWALSRFRPYPASVEVETALLVFFPLLMPADWYAWIAGGATAFYLVSALDSLRRVRVCLRVASVTVSGP